MQASWFSRQGGERARNSDAAAVGQRGQHLLAVQVYQSCLRPLNGLVAAMWVLVSARPERLDFVRCGIGGATISSARKPDRHVTWPFLTNSAIGG
jgi:hypothetical protein